jgi:hypothetical protein
VGAHLTLASEVAERTSARTASVDGFPMCELVQGRDLIKIDAEGIEHALLKSVMPVLVDRRPTLVLEVLPESSQLAAVISQLAKAANYSITIVPGYGSEETVTVPGDQFTAKLPEQFRSKDVILASAARGTPPFRRPAAKA